MTHFDSNEIVRILTERGAILPCPRCGRKEFSLEDGFIFNTLQSDFGVYNIGGSGIPSIVTVCRNCGFMSQHAIGVLGLLPKEKKSDEEKNGS